MLDAYREGDMVWVQDYHLMLVPSMLRAAKPHMKIGLFPNPLPCQHVAGAIMLVGIG